MAVTRAQVLALYNAAKGTSYTLQELAALLLNKELRDFYVAYKLGLAHDEANNEVIS